MKKIIYPIILLLLFTGIVNTVKAAFVIPSDMMEERYGLEIKIEERTVNGDTEVEYDVSFPIYRKVDYDRVELTRIDKDLIAVTITRRKSEDITTFNLEFEQDYNFKDGSIEFMLGRGIYASSEEEFYKMIGHARSHIDAIINQKNNK